MTHIEAILAELAAAPAVTALVADRIWPHRAADQKPLAPFIILRQVSAVPEHTMDGLPATLLESARIQVSIYAGGPGKPGYKAAHQVAVAVDNVLGELARPELSAVKLGAVDLFDEETELTGVAVDYSVMRGRDG